jgi:hypothetical protein
MTPEMPRLRLPLGRYRGRVINPAIGDRAARADMLNQRAGRHRSFGPAVALALRCRNGTWKQPHDGGCARRPGPPRRRNTAAGPLPYPEFRRHQSTPLRINEVADEPGRVLRLGTELGDLPRARAAA